MKKKTVKLSIQEPCHEDWSNMTPNEKGRFCDSCAKPVIDFSKATDLEIIRFLDEHKGQKTCGRFKSSQLERPMAKYVDSKISAFNLRAVMFGATLTSLLGLESCRNEEEIIMGDIAPVEQTTPPDSHANGNSGGAEVEEVVKMGEVALEEYDHSKEKLMTGVVSNLDSVKIAHAKLTLYDENEKEIGKTFTKDDGSFRLELNWEKKPSYVVITAEDYLSNSVYLKTTELLQEMQVILYSERMIQGEMMIYDEH